MSKVVLTAQAKRDLMDIKGYISRRLMNPIASKNTLAAITKELSLLKTFPELGAVIPAPTGNSEARALLCKNYLAIYRVAGDVVYVDRIVYGRRDYMTMLFGDLDEQTEQH